MAATHPASLKELLEWMAEDIEVNRRRGGLLSVVAVVAFRLNQFGVRVSGPASALARVVSLPLVAFARLGIGVEIPGGLACGRRLVLAHGGRGVIFHPDAVLGDDVAVASGCGAGVAFPHPGAPVIGDRVYFGANSSIIGDVTVGDDAVIGAHTLVTRSVPAGMVAVGVPAKILGPAPERAAPTIPAQADGAADDAAVGTLRRSSW